MAHPPVTSAPPPTVRLSSFLPLFACPHSSLSCSPVLMLSHQRLGERCFPLRVMTKLTAVSIFPPTYLLVFSHRSLALKVPNLMGKLRWQLVSGGQKEKSCRRETLNLATCANSSTNTKKSKEIPTPYFFLDVPCINCHLGLSDILTPNILQTTHLRHTNETFCHPGQTLCCR